MRFVVLGAGAVGGTIGGLLADQGYDVHLLARGPHADAIRTDGLRVATPQRTVQAALPVTERPDELSLRDDDVLLLTTKTQDTAGVLDSLPRRDLPLVCVQNGVANERMALRRCARVYAAVVMLPAVFLSPGQIDAQGTPHSGLLDLGRYPVGVDDIATAVAEAFAASGFVAQPVADIMRWKYAKLLRNLGNSMEALIGHDLDDAGFAEMRRLDDEAQAEAIACYRAAGIDWADDDQWLARRGTQVQWAPVEGRDRGGGSTWQSLQRGTGSVEADYLNGEITLLGRLHGIPTPVNCMLQEEVRALLRRGGRPGSMRPADLRARVDRMGS